MAGCQGKIAHMRVGAGGWGPPNDWLRTEVIVVLDGSDKYYGFEIKPGPDLPARLAMLAVFRDAYVNNLTVGFAYHDCAPGKKAAIIDHVDIGRDLV